MAVFSIERRIAPTKVLNKLRGEQEWMPQRKIEEGAYQLEDTSSNILGEVRIEGSRSSLVVDERVEEAPYVSCDYGRMDQNLLAFQRTPEGEVTGVTVENYCFEGRMRIQSRRTGDIYQLRRVA